MAPTVPASEAVPLTLVFEAVEGLTCTTYNAPDWNARLPATVIVPGVPTGPGTRKPPVLTTVEPTVPLPRSAAPLFTVVRLDDAIEPFTVSAPPLTLVGPVYVLFAVRTVPPA